jgi:apoptosis-inducing factor 2
MFAVGDIADSGAHKAARPGVGQAAVAAKNIAALVEGRGPTEKVEVAPAGIHLTLGLVSPRLRSLLEGLTAFADSAQIKNIVFRNPIQKNGDTQPWFKWRDE